MNITAISISAQIRRKHPDIFMNYGLCLTATVSDDEDLDAAYKQLSDRVWALTRLKRKSHIEREILDTQLTIDDREEHLSFLQEELDLVNDELTGNAETPADDSQPIGDFEEGTHQGN